jgi:hypothetical protein
MLGWLSDHLPIDASRHQLILNLTQVDSILKVLKEVIDVAVISIKRIDPHLEDSLLLRALRIVLLNEHLGCSVVLL